MSVLIGIALKSLIIAGIALGLVALMKRRSAAERSWVAHIGLFALVIMAIAPLGLPTWTVEAPALLGQVAPVETAAPNPAPAPASVAPAAAPKNVPQASTPSALSVSPAAAVTAAYAVPAAILLFITLLALARLIALRARADVLVDGHWLSALARAQRRMGFKHGTALLTSNELSSPISWGLMRPVILLNNRAVEASGEAEAIIAHELAHVARMDWIKLLLARIATALFWFNPFVWMLAREAHQLREEAADDAVLAADIPDTDYAQLLVGVARHECPGLMLGAHGVAPSRSSLSRRVARVLDGKSVRGPIARSFAVGVFVGAVLVAAPLAALTLAPGGSSAQLKQARANGVSLAEAEGSLPYYTGSNVPTDLPHIIAEGVTASVQTAVAAVAGPDASDFEALSPSGASVRRVNGVTVSRSSNGATVTVYPADAHGRSRVVARGPNGATAVSYVDADEVDEIPGFGPERRQRSRSAIDEVIEMRASGLTADYVNAMRAVSPELRSLDPADLVGMKSVGVTPEYARALAAAGFRNIDEDDLTQAKAIGLSPEYVRGLVAAGLRPDMEDFAQLHAVGVPVEYVVSIRRSGHKADADKLVEMWTVGVKPEDLKLKAPVPPRPPRPPVGRDDNDDPDG